MLYICYELLLCSLELYLTECGMCFELETECRFLFNNDGWRDVSLPVATLAPSSDRQITSVCPSLLGATERWVDDIIIPIATRGIVAMGVFCQSLLYYHYSDTLVVTGWLPMTIVTNDSLLQCMLVVVLPQRA
jgi:hypothetical protein